MDGVGAETVGTGVEGAEVGAPGAGAGAGVGAADVGDGEGAAGVGVAGAGAGAGCCPPQGPASQAASFAAGCEALAGVEGVTQARVSRETKAGQVVACMWGYSIRLRSVIALPEWGRAGRKGSFW